MYLSSKEIIRTAGLMTGTSMDGLDCGLFNINISDDYRLNWQCIFFETISYSKRIRQLIESAMMNDEVSIYEADIALGDFFKTSVTHLIFNMHSNNKFVC